MTRRYPERVSTFPAARASRPVPHRRILLITVVGGAVAVATLWAASAWVPLLVHAAVVVAVCVGAVALWAALAEFAAYRRRAEDEQAALLEDHRTQIHTVHQTQREVLAAIDVRTRSLRSTLDGTRAKLGETRQQLGEARQTVSRLRGDNEALKLTNAGLHERLAEVEAQAAGADADVFALPRRRATGTELDALEAPTVIDLDLQRLASPFVEDVVRRHAN